MLINFQEGQKRSEWVPVLINNKINLVMEDDNYTADINKLDSKALSVTMTGPFIVIDETTQYVSVKMYFLKQ